jgi:hypothetical protein
MSHIGALVHVGTGDNDAGSVEYLCQRTHGYAAHTYQMSPHTGTDIFLNVHIHDKTPFEDGRVFKHTLYYIPITGAVQGIGRKTMTKEALKTLFLRDTMMTGKN